ncbi:MAG: HAD hydrolase family protein [Planctomycetota bacterium]
MTTPAQASKHFSSLRRFDAVVCDIDGCLGPETHAPMDARALARIAAQNLRAATARDVPTVTLCSGRPQPFAEAISRIMANSTLPVICEMGVWLYDPSVGTYTRDPAITGAHLLAVAAATAWIEEHLIPTGVVIQPGKVASISIWHPDLNHLMSLKPRLVEQCASHDWPFRISSSVNWVNLDLSIVSKATGIERFIRTTGIPASRIAGIGDTIGDLAIARSVGYFATPSNVEDELRPHAAYVSPHAEIEGVLDILRQLS